MASTSGRVCTRSHAVEIRVRARQEVNGRVKHCMHNAREARFPTSNEEGTLSILLSIAIKVQEISRVQLLRLALAFSYSSSSHYAFIVVT